MATIGLGRRLDHIDLRQFGGGVNEGNSCLCHHRLRNPESPPFGFFSLSGTRWNRTHFVSLHEKDPECPHLIQAVNHIQYCIPVDVWPMLLKKLAPI